MTTHPEGLTRPSDDDQDECVCGTTREAHYNGTGSSMLNLYHMMKGEDICRHFQLYKRASEVK